MPLPPGLLPTGQFDKSASYSGQKGLQGINAQKPSAFSGGSAGLSKLQKEYDPLSWNDFFDSKEMVNGHTPVYIAGTEGHLFFCLHGAGHSAMTFAALAEKLKAQNIVVAFDFRGHGENTTEDQNDCSQETLIDDSL